LVLVTVRVPRRAPPCSNGPIRSAVGRPAKVIQIVVVVEIDPCPIHASRHDQERASPGQAAPVLASLRPLSIGATRRKRFEILGAALGALGARGTTRGQNAKEEVICCWVR
jgi:hypothetical protein